MGAFEKKPQSPQEKSAADSTKRSDKGPLAQDHSVNPILHLQRIMGNQTIQRILRSVSQETSEENRLGSSPDRTIRQRTGQPVIQREEARQTVTVPVVYTQALDRLQNIDAGIHRHLQRAGWDTDQQILLVSSGVRNVAFHLRIREGSLPPGIFARFVRERVDYSDPTNPIYPMTITLTVPSGLTAVDELTLALYHEGVHMLIYIDQNLPSPQSPHGAALDRYLAIARGHQSYASVLDSLVRYIQAFPPSAGAASLPTLQSALTGTLSAIVEEKYVHDQEQAHQLGPGPTNSQLARGYVAEKLASMGVRITPTDQDLVDAIQGMTTVFDAIDAQMGSQPQPGGGGAGGGP
ncbi:MAG: hypothetical protein A4E62_02283 [Syntrophorhabdus sp. PtaU1.Bin002]|nr:MAG: hypothetical protein A4E62_02283 [Syntrophorhabdus sp. PtaU1.Bin002]